MSPKRNDAAPSASSATARECPIALHPRGGESKLVRYRDGLRYILSARLGRVRPAADTPEG